MDDDAAYAELAHQLLRGDYPVGVLDRTPVFPLRVGIIAPAAACFKIGGVNEWAMVFYPFILSIAAVFLAYLAGKMFFSESAGLIAAFILAIIPLEVRSATTLLPDLPSAFWSNAGIVLLMCGSKKNARTAQAACGMGSGVCLGVSWLCKESTLYIAPFILLYMAWLAFAQKRSCMPLIASFSTAALGILAAEMFVYYHYTDDMLFRFHEIERNYRDYGTFFFKEGSVCGWQPGHYWSAVAKRLFIDGPKTIFLQNRFGYINLAALLVLIYANITRKRSFLVPGTWFLFLIVMYNFGSSSFSSYKPLALVFPRYLSPLLFPAVIIPAGFLSDIFFSQKPATSKKHPGAIAFGVLLAMLIFASSVATVYRDIQKGSASQTESAVAQLVSPKDPFYADWFTASTFSFFWGYPDKTRLMSFMGTKTAEIPSGAYVLMNEQRLDTLKRWGFVMPEFFHKIPDNWIATWSDKTATLYWVPENK